MKTAFITVTIGFFALKAFAATQPDLFVTNSPFSSDPVILSYDLDNGISSTLNPSDLDTFFDTGSSSPFFKGMDADETGVYWSNSDNNILFQGISSGSPTTLYANQTTDLERIAVHGTSLYWHSEDTDTIYKGSTDGVTAVTTVATGISTVNDLVATDDYIYYTNNSNSVYRVSTSGGTSAILFSLTNSFSRLRGIDVYNDMIYVAEYDFNALYSAAIDGSGLAEIPGLTVLHTIDLDIANDILFLLSDGGSVSASDRINVFDLNNLSNNGILVENIDLSRSLAVLSTIPEPEFYAIGLGIVSILLCCLRRKLHKS